ncbi:NACHT domain-containing protein [Crossiella sp. NPDC003009]
MTEQEKLATGDRIIRTALARWLGDEALARTEDLADGLARHIADPLVRRRLCRELAETAEVLGMRAWAGPSPGAEEFEAVVASVVSALRGGEPLPVSIDDDRDLDQLVEPFVFVRNEMVPLGQVVDRHRMVVLLGSPGAGKTAALRWLAGAHGTERTPVYVPLRECALRGSLDGLPARVGDRALLLLDGLDEEPGIRSQILDRLRRVMNDHPGLRCVLAVRNYPADLPLAKPAVARLQPMAAAELARFVRSWPWKPVAGEADPGASLLSAIQASPRLTWLATDRMLCAALCTLYQRQGGRLPADGDIRAALLDQWLEPPPTRTPAERPEPLSRTEKLTLLSGYAKGAGLSETLATMPRVRQSEAEVVSQLSGGGQLLREVEPGRLWFAHNTFREYLAAGGPCELGGRLTLLLEFPTASPGQHSYREILDGPLAQATIRAGLEWPPGEVVIHDARVQVALPPLSTRLARFLESLYEVLTEQGLGPRLRAVLAVGSELERLAVVADSPVVHRQLPYGRMDWPVALVVSSRFYTEVLWWQGISWTGHLIQVQSPGPDDHLWLGALGRGPRAAPEGLRLHGYAEDMPRSELPQSDRGTT